MLACHVLTSQLLKAISGFLAHNAYELPEGLPCLGERNGPGVDAMFPLAPVIYERTSAWRAMSTCACTQPVGIPRPPCLSLVCHVLLALQVFWAS